MYGDWMMMLLLYRNSSSTTRWIRRCCYVSLLFVTFSLAKEQLESSKNDNNNNNNYNYSSNVQQQQLRHQKEYAPIQMFDSFHDINEIHQQQQEEGEREQSQEQQKLQQQHNPSHRDLQSKIVGGTFVQDTEWSNFQYSSFVFYGSCAGTLIYPDIVVSAAHCRMGIIPGVTMIQIGGIYLDGSHSQTELILAEYVIVHPQYDGISNGNDIMIIKLNQPSTKPLQPLNFNPDTPYVHEVLKIVGYGKTSFSLFGGKLTDTLVEANVSTIATNTCNVPYSGTIAGSIMLCAGDYIKGGTDTCQGDSGGPIYALPATTTSNNINGDGIGIGGGVTFGETPEKNQHLRYQQVGITSFGRGCGKPGYPGVYTRMSPYKDFLLDMICGYSSIPPPSITLTQSPLSNNDTTSVLYNCSGRPIGLPRTCSCKWYQVFCYLISCMQ